VSQIENALSYLNPKPESVSSSIVSSWVTVNHDRALSVGQIRAALEDAGFDVGTYVGEDVQDEDFSGRTADRQSSCTIKGLLDSLREDLSGVQGYGTISHRYERMSDKHVEFCDVCQQEKQRAMSSSSGSRDDRFNEKPLPCIPAGHDGAIDLTDPLEDNEAIPLYVVVEDPAAVDVWRASIAIGGMTCISCVNAIKEEMERHDWIWKADINLLTNSANIDFVGQDNVDKVLELIEDLGYEAALDKVSPLNSNKSSGVRKQDPDSTGATLEAPQRTVSLIVKGMYCPRCPERVLRAAESLEIQGVRVDKVPTLEDPILKLTYTPRTPQLTIRVIIQTFASTDGTLSFEIYRPPTLEDRARAHHQLERRALLARVLLSAIIAIPTLIIGIVYMSLVSMHNPGRMYLETPLWVTNISRAQWALFILSTPVYFLCADLFHRRTFKEIRTAWRKGSKTPLLKRFYRFGSMDMLISMGTSIAYWSSVAQLVAAGVHRGWTPGMKEFYFDSVVFLTLFLLVGRLIEASSKARTGDAVAMLGKLRPTTAILMDAGFGTEAEVDVDLLEYGDAVKILYGCSPPVDGLVADGDTVFDESSLTGESRLVPKSAGSQVYSGTINKGSPISVVITGVAGNSLIDGIIEVVRDGQTRHAPIERIADTLTAYFVPLITLIAIVTWLTWLSLGLSGALPENYLEGNEGGWAAWSLQFAIAVFVIACPCGLGLAAPTALFVGGGLAAKYGVLVKGGGEAFEKASHVDCVVFDKTGTITLGGEPKVTEYLATSSMTNLGFREQPDILQMARKLEENSSHPIAKAIVIYSKAQETPEAASWDLANVTEIPGKGMNGLFSVSTNTKVEMILGNESLMQDHLVYLDSSTVSAIQSWKTTGKSIVLAAVKPTSSAPWTLTAALGISDQVRPEAASVIAALQKRGTAVWMLSGDNHDSACAIGAQVGIAPENIIAGVLPSDKADKIRYLQRSLKGRDAFGRERNNKRAIVAMVGDGINDSPALTAADVGIAVGSGSDIAISSAEFVLVTSNLSALITLLDLSKAVFRRIKFNFAWALVYNLIGVPVAAGVLYPIVVNGEHVRLDPVWASLAMALSSVSVVGSSLALRSAIPGVGFRGRKW
jgi:Cu+-exporting ATPase